MKLKIVYEDVAVGAREAFAPSASGVTYDSEPQLLSGGDSLFDYGNPCELNAGLLDGNALHLTPDDTKGKIAFRTSELADDDGVYETPPVLTFAASGLYTSQGITIQFDTAINRYARSLNIKWYKDGELLDDKDFEPDSASYYCVNKVEEYNKLVITFYSVNMPRNRLTVTDVLHGTKREFDRPDIQSCSLLHELDPVSASLKINTVDFELWQDTDVEYIFQQKQAIRTYFDDELVATTFVKSYHRDSRHAYSISSEDYISVMDDSTFNGGIYGGKSFAALVDEILTPIGVPYDIADSLANETVTGYIPICSCREALRQAAFAVGAVADTAYSKKLNLYKLDDTVKAQLSDGNTFTGQTVQYDDKLTELQLTAYAYVAAAETYTAYDAANSGTAANIRVTFPEPLHSLAITSGSIAESGANFAVITANSGCKLTGKRYNKTQFVTSVRNPSTLAGDKENVRSITDFTLVNRQNVAALAQKCYDYYSRRAIISERIIAGDVRIGDVVTQNFTWTDNLTGRVNSMKFRVSGTAKVAEVEIR